MRRLSFVGLALICLWGLGVFALAAGELPKSEAGVRQLVQTRTTQIDAGSDNGQHYLDRGEAYFILGQFDKAVLDATAAIAFDDGLDLAYYVRGLALGRMKFIEAGIGDLTVYLERHPDNSLALTKRGVRYLWINDLENAEKDLDHAIALDPSNAEAYDDLGVIYAKTERYAMAIKSFQATIRIDPTYAKAYHNLAISYHLSGNQRRAMKYSKTDVEMNPQSKSALFLKASILRAVGRLDEAQEVADDAEFLPDGNWSENVSVK